MKIIITGANGFIGSRLCQELRNRGDSVVRLARGNSADLAPEDIIWDYNSEDIDLNKLEGVDAVIHLAGENIMGRWTGTKKRKIYDSRVKSTAFLSKSFSQLHIKPNVFISASAIGVYGNSGDGVVSESSLSGKCFLAEVCRDWELASCSAADSGIRVANLRIGMVLGRGGGALERMLPLFKFGLGGRLGSGRQWMSWISLHDLIRGIIFVLDNDISGPINMCSPNPVRNLNFTQMLSSALHRSAFFLVPAFVLRAVLGHMANEVLLSSCRATPKRLLDAGFVFNHVNLENAFPELI